METGEVSQEGEPWLLLWQGDKPGGNDEGDPSPGTLGSTEKAKPFPFLPPRALAFFSSAVRDVFPLVLIALRSAAALPMFHPLFQPSAARLPPPPRSVRSNSVLKGEASLRASQSSLKESGLPAFKNLKRNPFQPDLSKLSNPSPVKPTKEPKAEVPKGPEAAYVAFESPGHRWMQRWPTKPQICLVGRAGKWPMRGGDKVRGMGGSLGHWARGIRLLGGGRHSRGLSHSLPLLGEPLGKWSGGVRSF
eukprot:TRINITY_DN17023_c0_g1_i1.p1 TRINITY_DN17023_c0_g1~~TRINITY_DN17023_c0_g1_i1.p1  ORF type:complete len:267 (+),score=37.74 TRINITY_DN17023_c0_g1_i1:59-802(+)